MKGPTLLQCEYSLHCSKFVPASHRAQKGKALFSNPADLWSGPLRVACAGSRSPHVHSASRNLYAFCASFIPGIYVLEDPRAHLGCDGLAYFEAF
jgi:hypothetical protein